MLLRSCLALLAVAVPSALASAKILIPLYSYDESCWSELTSAASANPDAQFVAILNPDSGPGDSSASDPSLYCVPYLRQQIPNIVLLGYVRTGYNERDAGEVADDVAAYRKWSSIDVSEKVEGTAGLDGIFFDESISGLEDGDDLSKPETYAQTARQLLGNDSTVIFNPGTAAADRLYKASTYVVCYESSYADFASATLPTDSSQQAQCMIMLHTFPSDSSTLSSVVNDLAPSYGGLWISDVDIDKEDIYQNWGSNWDEFVADVAALSTSSSSSSDSSSSDSTTSLSARSTYSTVSSTSSTMTNTATALVASRTADGNSNGVTKRRAEGAAGLGVAAVLTMAVLV
ncbi:hypothetical protein JCM8547_008841 [Rhodosporidiobolus lusitaniae]